MCTVKHAVTAGLRLAGLGDVVARAAKEVLALLEQLANAASAVLNVHDTGAEEVGALASVVAVCVRDANRVLDLSPLNSSRIV